MRFRTHLTREGFTLVELIVSIAIFALMTTLVVVKYGTFNQSVLLTNLAYDVALTIRTAQTYGLSVKSANDSLPVYTYAYGVNFNTGTGTCTTDNVSSDSKQFVMFSDAGPSANICDTSDILVSPYVIKRGATIYQVCAGSGPGACVLGSGSLTISFKRPDPRAVICLGSTCTYQYAELVLKATDSNTRKVIIRNNGQVTIAD